VSEFEQDFMAQPSFMKIRTSWKDQEIINHHAINLMLDEHATISHDFILQSCALARLQSGKG